MQERKTIKTGANSKQLSNGVIVQCNHMTNEMHRSSDQVLKSNALAMSSISVVNNYRRHCNCSTKYCSYICKAYIAIRQIKYFCNGTLISLYCSSLGKLNRLSKT